MAIHCPASILKLFLKQLHDQGLTLKSLTNNQVYKGETTEISAFLWEMFRYIFDSLPPMLEEDDGDMARVLLRLEDPYGIADNFGDKVKALIEYNSVDYGEARVLKGIWGGLQKMARKRIEQGFLDFDQDGLWYWRELNMSIAYLAIERTVLTQRPLHSQDPRPIHAFELHHQGWYPPEQLSWMRMFLAERRGRIEASKFEDRSIGDWWTMPLCDWDFFVPPHKFFCKGYREHRATEEVWLRMRNEAPDPMP